MRPKRGGQKLKHWEKMKINDILESYNKAIDKIRKDKGITENGHLMAFTDVRKSMGPYKEFRTDILYISSDRNNTYVCNHVSMERCLKDEEQKFVEKNELIVLEKLFTLLYNKFIWNQLIEGTYGTQ